MLRKGMLLVVAALVGACGASRHDRDGAPDGDADADADADLDGDADADVDADGPPCLDDGDCDDGNPCVASRCDPGAPGASAETGCVTSPAPEGTSCEGSFFCVSGEACDGAGLCDPDRGIPLGCDDTWACTVDACSEASTSCSSVPSHELCLDPPGRGICDPSNNRADERGCAPGRPCAGDGECDDGLLCNGAEYCGDGRCRSGTPPECDDGRSCTDDLCDDSVGGCVSTPVHARCGDGAHCTEDRCSPAAASSDPSSGCVHEAVACAGDGDPCTLDACSETLGGCYPPAPSGTPCDGVYSCTAGDTCDGSGDCDPGLSLIDCDDGNPCTFDECDEALGGCHHPPVPEGNACDDTFTCSGGDSCDALGHCLPGPYEVVCPFDADPCTLDECDEAHGGCYPPAPFGTFCDDVYACTHFDYCDAGDCVPGPIGVACPSDDDPCTADVCDETMGDCANLPITECRPVPDGCCPDVCVGTFDPDC